MNLKRDTFFLKKEYYRNLVPMMASVLGGTINTLIDSVFVSRVLGRDALTAVNMCLPIYLLLCCLGAWLAGGGSILTTEMLGQEKEEKACGAYRLALVGCFVTGAAVMIIGGLFRQPIASALAQGGDLTGNVLSYSRVLLAGAIPFVVIYIPFNYLQLAGKPKVIYRMSMTMVVLDTALDWLMLCVLHRGLGGAMMASVLSTLAACIYGLLVLQRSDCPYLKWGKPDMKMLGPLLRFGTSVAAGNASDTVRILLLNGMILARGGPDAAAVWAILNIFLELSLMITSGVPQAGAPFMGIFYPTLENESIRMLSRLECVTGLVLSGLYALIMVAVSGIAADVFNSPVNLLLPLLALGAGIILQVPASVWNTAFIWNTRLGARSRVLVTDLFVVLRRGVMPVAACFLLFKLKGYIWLFLLLGGALTLLAGYVMTGIVYRAWVGKPHERSRYLLLDDYLTRENKVLDFSIKPNIDQICEASEKICGFCAENQMPIKMVNRLGLSIEELLTVIMQRNSKAESMDLRVLALENITGIRIWCAGDPYNPFDMEEEDEDFAMGVTMLKKMAGVIYYSLAVGVNSISIFFDRT